MSTTEDSVKNKNEENASLNEDATNRNIETSRGNVAILDSNENAENIATTSKNMSQSATSDALKGANKGSGDIASDISIGNANIDQAEDIVTETQVNIDSREGSGDFTVHAELHDVDNTTVDRKATDSNDNIENEAETSKLDVINEENNATDANNDKSMKLTYDGSDDVADDDMELIWEDDDSTIANENIDIVKDNTHSEDQLLEDSNPNVEPSVMSLDQDISVESGGKMDWSKTEIITQNSDVKPDIVISGEKKADEETHNPLEDKMLVETDVNPNLSKINLKDSMYKDAEKHDDHSKEDSLLSEPDNISQADITSINVAQSEVEDLLTETGPMDNESRDNESSQMHVDEHISTRRQVEKHEDMCKEDSLLSEPEQDVLVASDENDSDNTLIEEKLLEENNTKVADTKAETFETSVDSTVTISESMCPIETDLQKTNIETEEDISHTKAKVSVTSVDSTGTISESVGPIEKVLQKNYIVAKDDVSDTTAEAFETRVDSTEIIPESVCPIEKDLQKNNIITEDNVSDTKALETSVDSTEIIPESMCTIQKDLQKINIPAEDDVSDTKATEKSVDSFESIPESVCPINKDLQKINIPAEDDVSDTKAESSVDSTETIPESVCPISKDLQKIYIPAEDDVSDTKSSETIVDSSETIPKSVCRIEKDLTKNGVLSEENLLMNTDSNAKTSEDNPSIDVSVAKVSDKDDEELLKDRQDNFTAMDVDISDPHIDDQIISKSDENDITQMSDSPIEQSPCSPLELEKYKKLNISQKGDAENNSLEIKPTENIIETSIVNKSEPKPKHIHLDNPSASEVSVFGETMQNTSICLADSPIQIKTDHSLHKPDVMLEIPTQELIDIDEGDLSLNLEQSDEISSTKVDNDKTFDNDTVSVNIDNKIVTEENSDVNVEKSHEMKMAESAARDTIEDSLERMFADDGPVAVKAVDCEASTSHEPDIQPSTSYNKMTPDTSDEVPEISDSLGLLAESSGRLMEDDEEPEDDEDVDEDDDFDQDESSNQVSAEQSEDSNPPASESEPARDEEIKIETPEIENDGFQFPIFDVDSSQEASEETKILVKPEYGNVEPKVEVIHDEETQSAVDAILTNDDEEVPKKAPEREIEAVHSKETQAAVDAILKDENDISKEGVESSVDQMDTEIETVKLSDTSDNEMDVHDVDIHDVEDKEEPEITPVEDQVQTPEAGKETEGQQEKSEQSPTKLSQSPSKQSPSKLKNLAISTMAANQVVNIVDLEESSSSEDDIQEVPKQEVQPETPTEEVQSPLPEEGMTKVNIPTSIDIMCTSGGSTSEMVTKEGEVVISGIPKPPPHRPARLNTSEVSIKTMSNVEPLVIPETSMNDKSQTDTPIQSKPKIGLEIFSLDSDEEDTAAKEKLSVTPPHKMTALELEKARELSRCINYSCDSSSKVPFKIADAATVAYYDAGRKRRAMVCQPCADVVVNRTMNLIKGIKNMTPLLDLEMGKLSQDLVEISDSESDDEDTTSEEPKECIGEVGAKFLQENLAEIFNATWKKYNMDSRLLETQMLLDDEISKLELDSKEVDQMLNECQIATDKLRSELYATFETRRQELPSINIVDTPELKFVGPETQQTTLYEPPGTRLSKRRLSSTTETPAKRPPIPLGYSHLEAALTSTGSSTIPKATIPPQALPSTEPKLDDDKDISVVKLSVESAPADLPPPGEISRPPLRVGMSVYAMKNAFGPWLKGRILEIQPKNVSGGAPFSLCRVKFDHKSKNNGKILSARGVAYAEPADVRMTIGTRLIAVFKNTNKRESYYSGVVAEIPNPVNNYRYLVFFDDGYAQYVQHAHTRLVCESSPLVWEEVHPFSREFVKEYLVAYPERPMVRLHEGQHLKTEWNGKWWSSKVTKVDASLAQVVFVGDGRREWIYRGSTRLAPLYLELKAAERHRPRPMPRSKAQPRLNMPYVEYTRSDEPDTSKPQPTPTAQTAQQVEQEIRRQRAVAKKSTTAAPAAPPPQQPPGSTDTVTSRVVYYTPKNAVKPYKMTPHKCGPKCRRSDVLSLKDLRTYNPLAKPLLSGWERQIVRFKGHKEVMYRAPCGRRLRNMKELHTYLRFIESELPVDLFDFHHGTHCLAEFVLNKCLVGKKDLSHGKENVPVPCVNYYDDSLPEFCSYNTERTPTAGVPLNLDPEFLCGCDCTDDCQDKSKCACWKMTLEGAKTIGLEGLNVGYEYKRLPEPLPSGIYECNSRCKCKHTCLNRVAQHPLQLKLQVFKTLNRGWGIRALNDVPKGSFVCVYAGNLLTDATANLDGLNEGDEYLAELDYIEVVEQMKEGYEEDIPEADKKLDKKVLAKEEDDDDDDENQPSSSEDDESGSKTDKEDDDFRPGYIGLGVTEFNKRLRKREKSKKEKEKVKEEEKDKEIKDEKEPKDPNADDDCITISDDEEVREPSRFMVQAGMGGNDFVSKYRSVRWHFGRDEACYIMDAKVQGNIGRYLNHSCCPNVFVQNVFVDTHDPRFPWVAFFALSHIKAGTELTWNYNYDVGSVPGKVLYCYCGAPNCRGRLL